MRISDWSSDVCSSDLAHPGHLLEVAEEERLQVGVRDRVGQDRPALAVRRDLAAVVGGGLVFDDALVVITAATGHHEAGHHHQGEQVPAHHAPRFFGHPIGWGAGCVAGRSDEHTSELQSLMRISYAVSCSKKKNKA